MVIAGALALGYGEASAQDTQTVYGAMTFKAEARTFRTSACLQLIEHTYPSSAWWESDAGYATGPDRAFKAVIAAIRQKDRASLLKLTDPDQARDTVRFDQQANAFFQQFDVIRLLAVPRAYEFDGLVVYFGKFQSASRTAFVPLTFSYQGGDAFGFLPSRSDKASFLVVNDWFDPSGHATADTPSYCTDAEVKRATHRVPLVTSSWRPSVLLLTGAPIDAPGPLAALAKQVTATIDQMKTALSRPNPDEFLGFLTPEGAGRLREWFATVDQAERDRYRTAFLEPVPFFVFDEGPLVVVYAKEPAGQIRVLYFTFADGKRLLWTNSSHITTSDRVFKGGPLFAAASSSKPFSGAVIK